MKPNFRRALWALLPSCAKFFSSVARLLALPLCLTTAQADTWFWDANGTGTGVNQGSGAWNTTNSNWWTGSANVTWNNSAGHIANFGSPTNTGPTTATSRTVTISGTVNASGLIFNRADTHFGYILTGGTVALANGSSIAVVGRNSTDLNRRHQIDSVISGADINITRSTLTTTNLAMLRLGGNNTWTGTLTLSSSAAAGIFVEAMSGASLNNLDNIRVGTNASLILATSDEFTKNFAITGTGAGARGAIRFDGDGGRISGNVTLEGDSSITSAGTGTTGTVSGIISETGGARSLTINSGSVALAAANTHSGGTVLSSGAILHINNAAALGTGTFTINGGTLNNTSGSPVTVANNAQVWNGNFSFAGANALDLGSGNVSLGTAAGTARTVTVTANTLTVGGAISNGDTAVGLTKAGAGTLVLSGANTYTGPTTLNAGTLVLSGGSTAATTAVVNGGTLNIQGSYSIGAANANVTISGTPANRAALSLADNAAHTLTLGALTVGTGTDYSYLEFDLGNIGVSDKIVTNAFTVNDGGAILNFNQITGTSLGAGTYSLINFTTPTGTAGLQIGSVPDAPAGQVAVLSLSNTATETLLNVAFAPTSSTNTAYWTGAVSSQWNSIVGSVSNFAESADGSGATNFLPSATTDVFFTANSTTGSANTTLGQDFSARSLHFTGTGTPATADHTIGGGSLLTLGSGGVTVDATSGNHTIGSRIHLGADQTWTLAGTAAQTFTSTGSISGGNLTVSGGRTLILTGPNSYGDTIINSGSTVQVGAGATSASLGTGSVVNDGTLNFMRSGNYTVSNDISGAGTINIGGFETLSSIVTFSGSNSYTGQTRIFNGGSLSVATLNSVVGGTATSNLGAPTTVENGTIALGHLDTTGSIRYSGTGETTDRVIDLAATTGATAIYQSGSGLLRFTSDLSVSGVGAKTLTFRGSGSGLAEFAGVISDSSNGATNIGKNDSGTWVLSAANTYTGSTTVSAGILRLAGAGTLGAGNLVMSSSATVTSQLDLNGTNQTVAAVTTGGAVATILNNATATTSTLTIGNTTTGSNTYNGILADGTGTLAITKTGTSTSVFAGTVANTYTGLTTISGGLLTLGKTDVNAIAGNILINGGALGFSRSNQIADTASVTVTAGAFNTNATASVNSGGLSTLSETIGSLAVSGSGVFNISSTGNVNVAGNASITGGSNAIFFMGSATQFAAESLAVTDMSRSTVSGASNAATTNGFVVYGANTSAFSVVKVGAGGLTLTANSALGNNIILRGGGANSYGSKLTLDGDVTTTGTHASSIIRDTVAGSSGVTELELSATETGPVTRTFNIGGGGADLTIGSGSANVSITNGLSSSAGLTKTGAGTLTLGGTNSYTGATNVTGGRLRVGGGGINSSTQISVTGATLELLSSNVIGDVGLTLNNATLIAGGPTESLGTLSITGNNQLDLVTVGNAIFFADSSSSEWASTLAILNWSGKTAGGLDGVDNRVVFGTSEDGLLPEQVDKIFFIDPMIDGIARTGTFDAMMLSTGEVVAVIPEASSALLIVFGSAAALGRRRRKNS